ncbi:MAG: DUF4381 family protein [Candidatus Electrothrix sp. AW3_4]|nr:DUF4381 family protein [Candidatus Electrothrix gigas]
MRNLGVQTVGAGSCTGCSGRTQGFTPTVFLFLLAVCIYIILPRPASADQITAPLAPSTPPASIASTDKTATAQQQDQDTAAEPALTENQLYDIREPILIPDSNQYLWWLAAVLISLLLLALLLYFWKKRNRKQKAVLAHETALRELDRAGPLIEQQDINAFITLIDLTLRRYIEQRFSIFARRQTTREFIHELAGEQQKIPQPLIKNSDNLKTWLQHCDLVKFAKAGLSRETMTDMVSNLRAFIESTKMEVKEK